MTDMREWDSRDRRIAAEALRQAAKQYGDLNLAEWEKDRVRNYLTARADELEGK